ncbi:MAG: DinB family protein [Candidatus Heimdallarchaeota archaeon]|nr:DinB family protein [Candidatus Heimdallarchaeota archaeon]MCK5143343.1 DinB family protein [Candidatus Heimdallarchaeota archaeon]
MDKEKTREFLKEEHERMNSVINSLNVEELVQYHIVKAWNIKDILAHLAAWNKELTKSIGIVLDKNDVWFRTKNEEEFNKIQVVLRKSRSVEEIIDEWKNSFTKLIEKIESLSDDQWNFDSGFKWKDGSSISVKSLFGYRKRDLGHEGWHAFQIEDYFESDRCACRVY